MQYSYKTFLHFLLWASQNFEKIWKTSTSTMIRFYMYFLNVSAAWIQRLIYSGHNFTFVQCHNSFYRVRRESYVLRWKRNERREFVFCECADEGKTREQTDKLSNEQSTRIKTSSHSESLYFAETFAHIDLHTYYYWLMYVPIK